MAKKPVMQVHELVVRILKSQPPQLSVHAIGSVNSTGWRCVQLQPMDDPDAAGTDADGMLDFRFVAEPPSGIVGWVIQPIAATVLVQAPPAWVRGVRVHAAGNAIEKRLDDADIRPVVF